MGKFTIDKEKQQEALMRAKACEEEACLTFEAEYDRLIAGDEPEGGVTRMEIIEELTRKLTNELATSTMRFVSDMEGSVEGEK